MSAGVIQILIPFPEAIYAAKPANSSGTFVDVPQTLLVWGVVYYAALIVWQFFQHTTLSKNEIKTLSLALSYSQEKTTRME